MSDAPVVLDTRRGTASQKATGLRRILAVAENRKDALREQQKMLETEILATSASTWPEAAAKAHYVLNLYAASLESQDARHRDLVTAVLNDFEALTSHE